MTESTWAAYAEAGVERALALGNRGPVRLDKEGHLVKDILDAYRKNGFYVFTGVLDEEEIGELTAEFDEVLDNVPTAMNGDTDRYGRPSPFGGYFTMIEDDDPATPARVSLLSHPFIYMESTLRVYAHPKILTIAESLYGPDFVPFHEGIFYKAPGNGFPTRWHQDGRTHWTEDGEALEQPDGGGKCHGYNMSVSWSNCTADNCLWVVPGSHRRWRLANGGEFPPITERLSDAVPMLLEPGDCGIVNRSALHGSYPNKVSRTPGHHGARLPQTQFGDRRDHDQRARLQATGEGRQEDHLHRGLRVAASAHDPAGDRRPAQASPGREALRVPRKLRRQHDVERDDAG